MPRKGKKSKQDSRSTIRVSGREWPIQDRITIGRRTYLVLDRIGHADRERYLVFDPHAGPGGDLRGLLMAPASLAAKQHLRVLKRLSTGNTNLPLMLDYRSANDQLMIVTTWVSGPDLENYLDDVRAGRKPRPSATEAFRLFRGLAHGLSQLHRRHGIVHGDIKPANLILASGPVRLVMIDYGSAWLTERTKFRCEGDGVSVAYAAPELQTAHSFADFRSDQFAATVLLYELLTLVRPYDGLGGQAGRPEYVSRFDGKLICPSQDHPDRPHLPKVLWREIDELVIRGLAFDPDARFATPDAWLSAVDAIFAQLKPRSHLTPWNARMTRVIRWCCRFLGKR